MPASRIKIWTTIGIIVIVVIALVAVFSFQPREEESIKIGVILPLSGESSLYGEQVKEGVETALYSINIIGGINNREIQMIYEDDKGVPKEAVTAAQKLIQTDNVKVILGLMFSGEVLAVAPIAESNKVVVISPTASAVEISNAGDYIFRIWPSDTFYASRIAEFVLANLGLKEIAVIFINNDWGMSNKEVFVNRTRELGSVITIIESYQTGATDFRTQLTKIKATNPDGIYMVSHHKDGALILKQAKELGIEAQFIGLSPIKQPEFLEIAGEAAEGIIYAVSAGYDLENEKEGVKKFLDEFKDKYGKEPGFLEALGYDLLKIVSLSMKGCSDPSNSECIKNGLYEIKDYDGAAGLTSFDENGDVIKPILFETVKNSEFVLYEE